MAKRETPQTMHVLFMYERDRLAGYFYHPNRAAVEAKRDEMAGDRMSCWESEIVEYVRAPGGE